MVFELISPQELCILICKTNQCKLPLWISTNLCSVTSNMSQWSISFEVFPLRTSVCYFLIVSSSPCLSCLPLSITQHSASDFSPSCEYYEYITDSSESGAGLFLPLAFEGVSAFWPMSSPLSSHPCSFKFKKAQTDNRCLGFSCLLYPHLTPSRIRSPLGWSESTFLDEVFALTL